MVPGELYCITTTHWAPSRVTEQKGLLLGSTLKDAGGGASWCRNIRSHYYYRDGELSTFTAFLQDSQSRAGDGIVLDDGPEKYAPAQ